MVPKPRRASSGVPTMNFLIHAHHFTSSQPFSKRMADPFYFTKENNRNGTFISSIKDIEKNLWTWYLYQTFMDIYIIDVTLVKVFKSSVRFTEVGRDGNYWDGEKILTRFWFWSSQQPGLSNQSCCIHILLKQCKLKPMQT